MPKIRTMAAEEFLRVNEPAAQYLFEGVRRHLDLMDAINMYDVGRAAASTDPDVKARSDADLTRFHTYAFTVATLCGAILQLADMGLYMCSQNRTSPASCAQFANAEMAKYCVGREIHGLPLGAYIHAGRNQFAHWSDEEQFDRSKTNHVAGFNKFTQGVFDHLLDVHYDHPFADLVFDLGNHYYGGTPIRATEIVLDVIRWRDYAAFHHDMVALFESASKGGA